MPTVVVITILCMIVLEPELFTKQVQVFPPTPELNNLGQTPEGTFYWPRDVAVNGSNYIFVADTQNSRGQIFFPNGTFHKVFGFPGNNRNDGSLNQPFGLTISDENLIFVTDTFTNVVKVYSKGGDHLSTLFNPGTGDGLLYYPSGIAFNGTSSPSEYFVADTFNNRLQVFNHTSDPAFNNKFIRTIP